MSIPLDVRYYCLQHGGKVGDVIGVTTVTGAYGRTKYMEWVMTPRGVLQRWLMPIDMPMG